MSFHKRRKELLPKPRYLRKLTAKVTPKPVKDS